MKTVQALLFTLIVFGFVTRADAKVGEWVGYEAMENRLSLRLFHEKPGCRPPAATIAEYKKLDATQANHSNDENTRYQKLLSELSIKPGFVLAGVIGDFQPRTTNFAQLLGSRFQPALEAFLMESSHAVNALNTFAWELTLRSLADRMGNLCDRRVRKEPLTVRLTDPTLSIASCRSREVPLREPLAALIVKLCEPGLYGKPAELRDSAERLFEIVTGFNSPEEEGPAWIAEVTKTQYAALSPRDRIEMMFRTLFLNPYFLLQH